MTLEPQIITVRLKGTRRSYSLDIAGLYTAAVRAEVNRREREKRARKGRK